MSNGAQILHRIDNDISDETDTMHRVTQIISISNLRLTRQLSKPTSGKDKLAIHLGLWGNPIRQICLPFNQSALNLCVYICFFSSRTQYFLCFTQLLFIYLFIYSFFFSLFFSEIESD